MVVIWIILQSIIHNLQYNLCIDNVWCSIYDNTNIGKIMKKFVYDSWNGVMNYDKNPIEKYS